MTWYQLGVIFAVNGLLFLAGIATVLLVVAAAAMTLRTIALPAARKTTSIRARRRTWRQHRNSGRA